MIAECNMFVLLDLCDGSCAVCFSQKAPFPDVCPPVHMGLCLVGGWKLEIRCGRSRKSLLPLGGCGPRQRIFPFSLETENLCLGFLHSVSFLSRLVFPPIFCHLCTFSSQITGILSPPYSISFW